MTGRSPLRRAAAASVASTLASTFLFLGALGTPAAAAAPGPYSGYAHSSAVHLDAVTNGTTRLVNVDAAVANAAIDSAGLEQTLTAHQRPVIDASKLGKNSYASSRLLDVGLAQAPSASGQVKLDLPSTQTIAAAPGDDAVSAELLRQQVSTIANATVLQRSATPQWNGTTCIIGEPIAEGTFSAARLELVDQSADPATSNFDGELIGITGDSAGPDRDAVNSVSLQQLYDGAGEGFGLLAATMQTIAPVTLFEGSPNEVTIELLGAAVLRVMADGTPGGAKVEFEAPAVSVIQKGVRTVYAPNDTLDVIEIPTDSGGVLQLRIGQLDERTTASNGTAAKARGAVVTLRVLGGSPAPEGFTGGTLAIGHVEAAVTVPAGGILCPLRVEVDATPPAVPVGKTVLVTTTVYNDYACPIVNVKLVDTLRAEDNARFTIVNAPGAVRYSTGVGLTTGFVEWLIPRIEAGGKAVRTFTIRMDDGAGRVLVTANAAGALLNCPATPGGDDASVSGLGGSSAQVSGSSGTRVPVSKVLGGGTRPPARDLPTTGVASMALAGIALLSSAGGLAYGLRRKH